MNIVPVLSKKGFFARYYGGRELYESLDDKPGSPVHPTFLATCLLFQVSMYCFKKIQQRKITSSLVNKTPNAGKIIFDSHCSRIWMTWKVITFTNSPQQFTLAWTISTVSQLWVLRRITQFLLLFIWLITVNTIIALLWLVYHFLSKKTQDDFTSVPLSLYLYGVMLTCLSLWPYMTNLALRQYSIKIIKNELNALFWSPKKHKLKQKSLSNLNVSMSKKNRRKVDFGERTANLNFNASTTEDGRGRVECIEMIAMNRSTLPDAQIWFCNIAVKLNITGTAA